jgi:membrane fusion protein (multidrug efflux system)
MKILTTALVLVALGVLAWWQWGGEDQARQVRQRPAAPVTVFEAEARSYRESIPALGTLQAWESIDITTSVSQLVTELSFEDGQQVQAGQVLARLRQGSEQATLSELQARLEDARRELRRLENLAGRNQVAQTELDSGRTAVEVLEFQIKEIRARLADRNVVAPFAGVLGLREVSEGALVAAGQRLTTLDDVSRMRLGFTVPERFLGVLEVGQEVIATTAAYDRDFTGTLTAIDSRVDPTTRSITARAVIPNDQGLLRPGMLMELDITSEARQVVMVPEESLQSRGARQFVWKVEGDSARRTEVNVGGRLPGWVVINEGLSAGERIVRDGVVRLSGSAAQIRVVSG